MVFFLGMVAVRADSSMNEYQVKAQFLLNFVKYIDWPENASAGASSPIVIGIMGKDNLNNDLQRVAEGKSINGRTIIIKSVADGDALGGCAILFISASEDSQLDAILGKTSAQPILTVGEDRSFLQKGGIINFALKDGKIRLEINLRAARQAKLQISSKLLSVADVVQE